MRKYHNFYIKGINRIWLMIWLWQIFFFLCYETCFLLQICILYFYIQYVECFIFTSIADNIIVSKYIDHLLFYTIKFDTRSVLWSWRSQSREYPCNQLISLELSLSETEICHREHVWVQRIDFQRLYPCDLNVKVHCHIVMSNFLKSNAPAER